MGSTSFGFCISRIPLKPFHTRFSEFRIPEFRGPCSVSTRFSHSRLMILGNTPPPLDNFPLGMADPFESGLLIECLPLALLSSTHVSEIGRDADYILSLAYPEFRFVKCEIRSGPNGLIPSMLYLLCRTPTSDMLRPPISLYASDLRRTNRDVRLELVRSTLGYLVYSLTCFFPMGALWSRL